MRGTRVVHYPSLPSFFSQIPIFTDKTSIYPGSDKCLMIKRFGLKSCVSHHTEKRISCFGLLFSIIPPAFPLTLSATE